MKISANTKRELWSQCAGYCQNPSCNTSLVVFIKDNERVFIDEFAHIIPQSPGGPRNEERNSEITIDSTDNIVMLCPTCHKKVDSAPLKFSKEILLEWKSSHVSKIKALFHTPTYTSRNDLKSELDVFFLKNKNLFDSYGSYSTAAKNPISDSAVIWRKYIITDILPNNRRIIERLDTNMILLNTSEKQVVEEYRLHIEAFEYNHVSGEKFSEAPLFPVEITKILSSP